MSWPVTPKNRWLHRFHRGAGGASTPEILQPFSSSFVGDSRSKVKASAPPRKEPKDIGHNAGGHVYFEHDLDPEGINHGEHRGSEGEHGAHGDHEEPGAHEPHTARKVHEEHGAHDHGVHAEHGEHVPNEVLMCETRDGHNAHHIAHT